MKRLGKQRVETYQILRTLAGLTQGWQNHPAVIMWRGNEHALIDYGVAICEEWIARGYKDTCLNKILDMKTYFPEPVSLNMRKEVEEKQRESREEREEREIGRPIWLGDPLLHLSHQSNLLRKDFNYYSKHFVGVPTDLPYYWPVHNS